jgi:hypothetical protein
MRDTIDCSFDGKELQAPPSPHRTSSASLAATCATNRNECVVHRIAAGLAGGRTTAQALEQSRAMVEVVELVPTGDGR